jgi:hypothetical protein
MKYWGITSKYRLEAILSLPVLFYVFQILQVVVYKVFTPPLSSNHLIFNNLCNKLYTYHSSGHYGLAYLLTVWEEPGGG